MPQATSGSAAPRATEGTRIPVESMKRRSRGRPPGSANKPKSMVPAEFAKEILTTLQDIIPAESFAYLKGVVMDGKAVSTKAELDTLIVLLNRSLWGALVEEMRPPTPPDNIEDALEMVKETGTSEPKQQFRRDVTERLKVLNSLLTLRSQIEKREEDKGDDGESALVKIWAARGMAGRVTINVERHEPTVIEGRAVPV